VKATADILYIDAFTLQEILVKINDCNAKLDTKRVEIEQLLARRAAVAAEFDATVPDNELSKDQLSKIFNRCNTCMAFCCVKQPALPIHARVQARLLHVRGRIGANNKTQPS